MKYFSIMVLFFVTSNTVIAQRLKLIDLQYALKTNDISKIQNYLLKKGLSFDEKSILDDFEPKTLNYSFSNNEDSKESFLYFDVNQIKNQIYTTSIATKLLREFNQIKESAEAIGFKLVKSDFEENISFTDLKLNNYRLTLIASIKDGSKVYQIYLTDIKLENFLFSLKNND